MKITSALPLFMFFIISCSNNETKHMGEQSVKIEAEKFLENYNTQFQQLLIVASEAEWKLNTMIIDGDTVTQNEAERANEALAAFTGSRANIENAKRFLADKQQLSPIQIKQLEAILYAAGANPEIAGDIVKQRIKAETEQTKNLFGFNFIIGKDTVSANDIDKILVESKKLDERQKAWDASKEVGRVLKPGLTNLRDLRNKCVQALEYKDFFAYQVSEYGMTSDEMLQVNKQFIKDLWPLYRELHTWARYYLSDKYKQPVPEMLPAHWLPNRWGQEWADLVEVKGLNLDDTLKKKSAEWIVKEGENFYISLGFEPLPASFYEKSSLYPLPANAKYKKNNHASAWHMDNDKDVRSLMSVEPNTRWWETTLHELGHIYYYITYTNPDVPIILRAGANRAYHEAMGSQIGLASLQKPFLEQYKLIPSGIKTDETQLLLKEALSYIVVIPWASGVMTEFEHELYANNLPENQFNKKWWELVKKYQGIIPPTERGEEYCDAASKTHINNDPAQYYDYAMSNVLLFQFHVHIAQNILKQDAHATNYYGNKQVGDFLKSLMYPGATVDWKEHLEKKIGHEMSAKAMVEYFSPLMVYLQKVNKGRQHSLPEVIE
jgi:peptidyl-dipeptidase A